MKANAFEKLIRKVVREEIDYSLRREIKTLKEDLRDELKPTIIEQSQHLTKVPKNVQTSLKDKIMGKEPKVKKTINKQNFASNNTLNDLLNETAQGDINLYNGNSLTSTTQPFNSPDPIPIEVMPSEVANVVNRDYRELMRDIDNKKGKK